MPDGSHPKPNVLVLLRAGVTEQAATIERQLVGALEGAIVSFASAPAEAVGGDHEIIITPSLPWLPEVIASSPNLRWVHFLSAGVDKMWAMPFAKTPLILTKSSGVHAAPMSEFALGAMLQDVKQFGRFVRQQLRREWERTWLDELTGKTVGILGLGSIGREIARKAAVFGMRVIGTVSRPRPVDHVAEVFGPDGLDGVLARSDYLVVTVPLTDATRGLLDGSRFQLVKPGSFLVNLARGGVVDETALIQALDSRRIAGAALDVFEVEPLPESSPLWGMENVLITPHVAGTTSHYLERATQIFLENYRSLRETGELTTPVRLDLGY